MSPARNLIPVLLRAGLTSGDADALAAVMSEPSPGTFAADELRDAGDDRVLLLGAIVAATDMRAFGTALESLLAALGPRCGALSRYDEGRYWHLVGFAAWRGDGLLYPATRALNRSVSILARLREPAAHAYLARVLDTLGQMLHRQGLMEDARCELEASLAIREELSDDTGAAVTLGNLGRLCMDLGDFAAAERYLERDLALVERLSPEATRLRAQLLSHLGTCALELGHAVRATERHTQSEALARNDANPVGLAFAALGLGSAAAADGASDRAREHLRVAREAIADPAIPGELGPALEGLAAKLAAELHVAAGDAVAALRDFEVARERFRRTALVSPIEHAHLLHGLAGALREGGEHEKAADRLREALEHLDATSASSLRARIEADLRAGHRTSWLLHAAGRFVGQGQIEFLLEEAGHGGFRGARKDVVTLFSDIRGFTGLSEQFSPERLVVFLNDYLGHMTRCVDAFGGMIDKFIGDAVMAIFSLPEPQPDDADRAVQSALLMLSELERFNRGMPEDVPPLRIGIGLHHGPVVAGLIGSPQKRSYTVLGDAVNTASRLEGMTKTLGASILVSSDVVHRLATPDTFLLRPLGRFRPKGRGAAVEVADLMGEDDGSRFARQAREEIERVRDAQATFLQRSFTQARVAFDALAMAAPAARAPGYQLLARQAAHLEANPPDDAWSGEISLLEK